SARRRLRRGAEPSRRSRKLQDGRGELALKRGAGPDSPSRRWRQRPCAPSVSPRLQRADPPPPRSAARGRSEAAQPRSSTARDDDGVRPRSGLSEGAQSGRCGLKALRDEAAEAGEAEAVVFLLLLLRGVATGAAILLVVVAAHHAAHVHADQA